MPALALASGSEAKEDEGYRKLAIFARVLSYVENNYVRPVDTKGLIDGAIRGMLATLDPHSRFMSPEEFAAVQSQARAAFGGIGVQLLRRDAQVVVERVYADGPAAEAGLELGDVLLAVSGRSTKGRKLWEVVQDIKGPPGSRLTMLVRRPTDKKKRRVVLVRQRIRIASVDWRRLDGGHAYVRIRSFTAMTGQHVKEALADLKRKAPFRDLVLDLRDNPGGLLEEAVRVADVWLREGVIVSTEGRHRRPELELAHPKGTEPSYPIVVLVNGGTASAAEIVAGALQDHGRAILLGTQTFGKGSVQTIIELEDRSALRLTVAKYYTPHRRSIAGTGMTPDVRVPQSSSPIWRARSRHDRSDALGTHDAQLAAALRLLGQRPPPHGAISR